VWVGVDVSKRRLDVHVHPAEVRLAVVNNAAGHAALVERLGGLQVHGIVLEASGGYERDVHTALAKSGLQAAIVNAARVRAFARALGLLAKTDRIDAAVLARGACPRAALRADPGGAIMRPSPTALPDTARAELGELLAYRRQVVAEIVARRSQLEHYRAGPLEARAQRALAALRAERAALGQEIGRAIARDPALAEPFELLTSAPGVGPIGAATLLAELPELGQLDRRQAASLAGLAPVPKDSGEQRGKRLIQGGRAEIRQALYMAVLPGLKANPVIAAIYRGLVARGKPGKVALVACMRRLLVMLNAMLRSRTPWRAASEGVAWRRPHPRPTAAAAGVVKAAAGGEARLEGAGRRRHPIAASP